MLCTLLCVFEGGGGCEELAQGLVMQCHTSQGQDSFKRGGEVRL